MRFVKAHFADIPKLRLFLEKTLGGEFFDDQLAVGQIVLDRIAKYLLLSGLDIELSLTFKVLANTTLPQNKATFYFFFFFFLLYHRLAYLIFFQLLGLSGRHHVERDRRERRDA